MVEQFSKVWFATDEKLRSMTKLFVLSDQGQLECTVNELQFRGKHTELSIKNITRVAVVRQTLPWVTYLVGNVALVLYLLYGSRFRWTPEVIAAILVPLNLVMIGIGVTTKWIQVDFKDESGAAGVAYFTDGSMMGWGSHFGGFKPLLQAIECCQSLPAEQN